MDFTLPDILVALAALVGIFGLAALIRRALGDVPLFGPGCGGG